MQEVGKRHPVVTRLRQLRRDRTSRDAEAVFVAEGLHLAAEALRSGARIEVALVSPRLRSGGEGRRILRALEEAGVPCFEASDSVVNGVQDAQSAQPVVMIVSRRAWNTTELLDRPSPLVGVAWGLQDPGNLGSLIRTLEATGATCCAVCGESVDPYHPRVVRASAGSILRLPLVIDTSDALRAELAARGIRTFATDAAAGVPYSECDFTGSCAVFFGNEGAGLPPEAAFDERVRIPLQPPVESLTVTAAAAVILFEAARQRRKKSDPSGPA